MEPLLNRTLLISALLGTVAAASPALAADNLVPDFRTSNFEVYVGAFGSGNAMRSEFRETEVDDPDSGYLDGTGFGYGVRAGADYVMDGWVLGAVADWSFGTSTDIARDAGLDADLAMPNLATIRARAGYTAGSALIYLTGGYAQAEFEYADDALLLDSDSDWTAGWTLGAGIDVAVTQQVSLGLEYLYLQLDDLKYSDGDDLEVGHDLEGIHSIRLGVNYAFQI